MIDLYLPPKPAIIRPAPLIKRANFLPGWFPSPVMAAERAAEVVWTDSDASPSDTSTYTFAATAIGVEHPSRRIIVGVVYHNLGLDSTDPEWVRLDGNDATQVITGTGLATRTLWIIEYPTGTTTSLAVHRTRSGGGNAGFQCSIQVWAAYYLKNTAAVDTLPSVFGTPTASGSLDVSAKGIAVGIAHVSATTTLTFGGLSTDDTIQESGVTYSGGSLNSPTQQLGLTVSATAGSGQPQMIAASFR